MRSLTAPLLVLLSLSLLFTRPAEAQGISTSPIALTRITLPPAIDASTPSLSVGSVPLYATSVFTGTIGSVDGAAQISISNAAFTANQFTAVPHLAKIKSGTSVGRLFRIISHTSTQLTLNTLGYTLTSSVPAGPSETQVSAGDFVEIVPPNTLATLFGSTSVPFLTGVSSGTADSVQIWSGTNWEIYFHNGTNWRKTGSFLNQNDVVVYPDAAILFSRRGLTPLTLTFTGRIASTTERTDLVGPGSTFKSNRFLTDFTFAGATNP